MFFFNLSIISSSFQIPICWTKPSIPYAVKNSKRQDTIAMMIPCLCSLLFGVVLVFLIYFLPAAPDRVPAPHLPHIAAHGNDFAVVIVLFQPRDDNGGIQTAGICQHDLFDLGHRNCLRSNQLYILFNFPRAISRLQCPLYGHLENVQKVFCI